MSRKKIISSFSILALLFYSYTAVFAETDSVVKNISLNEAFSIADKENIDITSARKNIDSAKEDINIAKEIPNPQIQPLFGVGNVFTQQGNPNQIGVSQLIEIAKRGARTKVAKSSYVLAGDTVKSNVFDLHYAIRQAYINLVSAKSNLVVLNEQDLLLERLLDIAQKRLNAGDVAEIDVLEAKLALNQVDAQIQQARSQVLQSRSAFNQALNTNSPASKNVIYDVAEIYLPGDFNYQSLVSLVPSTPIASVDKIQKVSLNRKFSLKINSTRVDPALAPMPTTPLPAFEALETTAINQRLDVKIAKDQVDVAQKSLVLAKRQAIPDIDMTVGYMYDVTKNSGGQNEFDQGVYFGPAVTLPIFNHQKAEISKSKIALDQAKLQLASTENKISTQLQADYEQLSASRDTLLMYKNKLLADSNQVVQLSQRRYEIGKSDLSSVILVQQEYQSIMTGYVNSLISYYSAWETLLNDIGEEKYE